MIKSSDAESRNGCARHCSRLSRNWPELGRNDAVESGSIRGPQVRFGGSPERFVGPIRTPPRRLISKWCDHGFGGRQIRQAGGLRSRPRAGYGVGPRRAQRNLAGAERGFAFRSAGVGRMTSAEISA